MMPRTTRNVLFATLIALAGQSLSLRQATAAPPSSPSPEKRANVAASGDFLRQYALTNRFRAGQPRSVWVAPDAQTVLFLRSSGRDFVQDLYQFDAASGKTERILTATELLGGTDEQLSAEERVRRERARQSARGIASFEVADDGIRMLVPLSGKLYLFDRETGAHQEVGAGDAYPLDPQFSPDGTHIACVRAGDLYVIDLETNRQRRLTETADDTHTNGLAEFVAQEEMGRRHGYWWSPDGRHLAYQQTDTSDVETLYISDPANPSTPPNAWRYPRPGKNNARVTFAMVSVVGGETVSVDWDREAFPYLASVTWEEHGPLTILVQNRTQTREQLLAIDSQTGSVTVLLREHDPTWINLDPEMPRWLPDGNFLWTTERRGAWQLELRDSGGELIRPLTAPGFGLHRLLSVDEDRGEAYVTASSDPLTSQIHRVSVAAEESASHARLTTDAGIHRGIFGENHDLWVHHVETEAAQSNWHVRRRDGTQVGELPSVAESPSLELRLEFVTTKTKPEFRTLLVRPRDFDPSRRYPVILHVYGGPHKQMVRRSGRAYFLDQWLADQGFVVVAVDGRGTPHRGRAWERAIHHNLVDKPLDDQVAALQDLGGRYPELDLQRVGVFGWSYGGYMAAMATIRRGDVFRAGVAGAPVTDWHDYDTHYTERYLGLPSENADGYRASSVLAHAAQLERPLLMIHGTADDNVYFLHSARLSDALLRAGRAHDFLPLVGATHMVTEPEMTAQLYHRLVSFLEHHLTKAADKNHEQKIQGTN